MRQRRRRKSREPASADHKVHPPVSVPVLATLKLHALPIHRFMPANTRGRGLHSEMRRAPDPDCPSTGPRSSAADPHEESHLGMAVPPKGKRISPGAEGQAPKG
jgi:hypothetical protein